MPRWHSTTATSSTSEPALLNYSRSLPRNILTLRMTRPRSTTETATRGSKDKVVIPAAASNKEVAMREVVTSPEAEEAVEDAEAAAVDLEGVTKTTTYTTR